MFAADYFSNFKNITTYISFYYFNIYFFFFISNLFVLFMNESDKEKSLMFQENKKKGKVGYDSEAYFSHANKIRHSLSCCQYHIEKETDKKKAKKKKKDKKLKKE